MPIWTPPKSGLSNLFKKQCVVSPPPLSERAPPLDEFIAELDHGLYFDYLCKHTQKAKQEYESGLCLPPLWKSYDNPKCEKTKHKGDEILEKAKKGYSLFEHKLTPQQWQMCECALKASLPKIYGSEWEAEKTRVLEENGWTSARPELFMVTPRRFGKTYGIASHSVVMLTTVPNFHLVLFAVRLRQSKMLLSLILNMFNSHPYTKEHGLKMVTQNKEQFSIVWPTGEKSIVDAYPSTTANIRGFDADAVIVDEANFTPDDVILKGIMPVVLQGKTAWIMLSTPTRNDTLFMRFISTINKETGLPLLQSIHIGGPCSECKLTSTPHKCTHNMDELPDWKSRSKQGEYDALMEDHKETNLQENWGMVIDDRLRLYPEAHIDIMLSHKEVSIQAPPVCIYLGVDPTNGGKCEFGIVGCFFYNNDMVVCLFFLRFVIIVFARFS